MKSEELAAKLEKMCFKSTIQAGIELLDREGHPYEIKVLPEYFEVEVYGISIFSTSDKVLTFEEFLASTLYFEW